MFRNEKKPFWIQKAFLKHEKTVS